MGCGLSGQSGMHEKTRVFGLERITHHSKRVFAFAQKVAMIRNIQALPALHQSIVGYWQFTRMFSLAHKRHFYNFVVIQINHEPVLAVKVQKKLFGVKRLRQAKTVTHEKTLGRHRHLRHHIWMAETKPS